MADDFHTTVRKAIADLAKAVTTPGEKPAFDESQVLAVDVFIVVAGEVHKITFRGR